MNRDHDSPSLRISSSDSVDVEIQHTAGVAGLREPKPPSIVTMQYSNTATTTRTRMHPAVIVTESWVPSHIHCVLRPPLNCAFFVSSNTEKTWKTGYDTRTTTTKPTELALLYSLKSISPNSILKPNVSVGVSEFHSDNDFYRKLDSKGGRGV